MAVEVNKQNRVLVSRLFYFHQQNTKTGKETELPFFRILENVTYVVTFSFQVEC
jgi:hypothetical protein